jgi:hypothetical protein
MKYIFDESLQHLDMLKDENAKIIKDLNELTNGDYSILARCADDIGSVDIAAMLIFGVLGAALSNNEKLENYLDDIHTDASSNNPTTLLGKLLHHKGDNIDVTTRNGETWAPYLHRLYGGHDIFAFNKDNPFYILVKQYGLPKGILQAVRHLLADPFSKNGGVLPFSSYLDFINEKGEVDNYLDAWAREISKGTELNAQEAYAELFAIKAQDIGATTVTAVLVNVYVKLRNLIDKQNNKTNEKYFSKIALSQLKIIALLANIVANATWGMIKNKGVPKINISGISLLLIEIIKFFGRSYKDLYGLENKTNDIIAQVNILEEGILKLGEKLPSYENYWEYQEEINRGYNNISKFVEIAGGERII